jgi:hypothetical protein
MMTEREKAKQVELQKLFEGMNKNGSYMVWKNQDPSLENGDSDMGIVVSWEVVRVLEKNGKFLFWLLFYFPGFLDDSHFSHVLLIKSWKQEDGYELDLIDSENRRFHLEELIEGTDELRENGWAKWAAYRKENQDLVEKIIKDIRPNLIMFANEWTAIP